MSGPAYLLNTSILTSDKARLWEGLSRPGNDYLEVAAANYIIPIPWLLCFRKEDLRVASFPIDERDDSEDDIFAIRLHGDDEITPKARLPKRSLEMGLPCTTVQQALQNITQALPIFIQLAGNEELGRQFWSQAIVQLKVLPLPYLTIDPRGALLTGIADIDTKTIEGLQAALSCDTEALPYLTQLSNFESGVSPYSLDVLYEVPGKNHNEARIRNTIALDFGCDSFWHLSTGSKEREDIKLMLREPSQEINLIAIGGEIESLIRSLVPDGGHFFGFIPVASNGTEQLKSLITVKTDNETNTLLHNPIFREKIGGSIAIKLKTVCEAYGFLWCGFIYMSKERRERDFNGDFDAWLSLPGESGS